MFLFKRIVMIQKQLIDNYFVHQNEDQLQRVRRINANKKKRIDRLQIIDRLHNI